MSNVNKTVRVRASKDDLDSLIRRYIGGAGTACEIIYALIIEARERVKMRGEAGSNYGVPHPRTAVWQDRIRQLDQKTQEYSDVLQVRLAWLDSALYGVNLFRDEETCVDDLHLPECDAVTRSFRLLHQTRRFAITQDALGMTPTP